MEEIQVVEAIEVIWPMVAKDKVYTVSNDGQTHVWFATEHKGFQLFLAAVIGKRRGLKEQVIVIDSSKPIVADRLHLANNNVFDGRILPLRQMRAAARDAADPIYVVVKSMEDVLCAIRLEPEQFFREATLPRLGLVSMSIDALPGGAWGGGKR